MYSGCHMNFVPHDCSCICHGTYCFTYIRVIYSDAELYPFVQWGKYAVLCTDHSLCSLYVILNSVLTSCPQFIYALHTFLSGGLWSPNLKITGLKCSCLCVYCSNPVFSGHNIVNILLNPENKRHFVVVLFYLRTSRLTHLNTVCWERLSFVNHWHAVMSVRWMHKLWQLLIARWDL